MDLEVEKLLRKEAIEEVEPCKNQFLSNIFTIPKKGGGRRPVVDMRDLNSFIELVHFKMEDLPSERGFYVQNRSARRISNHSDYKKVKDLSKVSLERETVPVHMSTFWPQILSKNFYKGSETPLGLPQSSGSLSVGVFRRRTYHGSNPRAMSGAFPADMAVDRFGFLGNLKKSVLNPKQQTEYLGFFVNSIEMKLLLMEEKLLRSKVEAECVLKSVPVVKMLASFLGFCQSTLPAITVAPLHFRKLQADDLLMI